MDLTQRFMRYAADFEQTLADDDWSRVEPHFTPDAVYVVESSLFGCEIRGRDAVLAGMKKSLDGFDRHFPTRDVEVTSPPEADGDVFRLGWKVIYHHASDPDFVLPGRSEAMFGAEGIVRLVDAFDEAIVADLAAWTEQTGVSLDPAYT